MNEIFTREEIEEAKMVITEGRHQQEIFKVAEKELDDGLMMCYHIDDSRSIMTTFTGFGFEIGERCEGLLNNEEYQKVSYHYRKFLHDAFGYDEMKEFEDE